MSRFVTPTSNETYVIKKGHKFPSLIPIKFPKFIDDDIRFIGTYKFDKSCAYDNLNNPKDNTLCGICFGLNPHGDSVGFDWCYEKTLNRIYILASIYIDGKPYKKPIFACDLNEEHEYVIQIHRSSTYAKHENGNTYRWVYEVEFLIDNEFYHITNIPGIKDKVYSNKLCMCLLKPSFADKAPHKMKIYKI